MFPGRSRVPLSGVPPGPPGPAEVSEAAPFVGKGTGKQVGDRCGRAEATTAASIGGGNGPPKMLGPLSVATRSRLAVSGKVTAPP